VIEGLRRAATGILPRIAQQETLANNLANALTPGFKQDRISFQAVLRQAATAGPAPALPGGTSYETVVNSRPDMRPGAMEQTGNPMDLALSGEGFFVVQTPAGERYTRAGNFTLNQDGEVALPDGSRLLSDSGPIRVEGAMTVSVDGEVTADGQAAGKLRVVKFPAGANLAHEGATLWTTRAAPIPATGTAVRQGSLEGSNVNTVEEMIDMLNAFRSYEANMKSAQAQSESTGVLVNNVGRSR
jgi:flagellar basal-body rod protein FlgF